MPTVQEAFETALALQRAGRLADAETLYRQIVAASPGHADAWHMLGATLLAANRPQEAIELLRQAVSLVPQQAEFHCNLGEAYRTLGRLDEAEVALRQAIHLLPSSYEAHNNLGLTLQAQGEFLTARAEFEQAIALRPDGAEAHFNLARVLLLLGELAAGWREYAWRERFPGHPAQVLGIPPWNGQPLTEGRLLLYAEQGLGDTLQFVRYVRHVARLCPQYDLAVPPHLFPLLSGSGYHDLISQPDPAVFYAAASSLATLPGLLDPSLAGATAEVPYLAADGGRVARWAKILRRLPGRRLGIAWQGNPRYFSDRFRSIPLAEFAPLTQVPDVQLVSLQIGPGSEQLVSLGGSFHVGRLEGLDADGTLLDTAAVMRSLDLVVTSDTAIAHLAGALGVSVWVALPFSPDWRWQLQRQDSPWYPTMRLFRQPQLGDWRSVFESMSTLLATLQPGDSA